MGKKTVGVMRDLWSVCLYVYA